MWNIPRNARLLATATKAAMDRDEAARQDVISVSSEPSIASTELSSTERETVEDTFVEDPVPEKPMKSEQPVKMQ